MSKEVDDMNTTIICFHGCAYLLVFIGSLIWMIWMFLAHLFAGEDQCALGSGFLTLVGFIMFLYISPIVKAVYCSVKNFIIYLIDDYKNDN
jgi:hypothetical protein